MGRTATSSACPTSIWDRPDEDKWALLSGLWEGDGSWSLVNGGPSVILEMGTVSAELADGVLRLLGDLGIVASQRIGRTAMSTKDTHWLRVSGADQVERAMALVPERDRPASLPRSPGSASGSPPPATAGVTTTGPLASRDVDASSSVSRDVYSLEVPGTHSFVTTGGLTTHNCFPKM